MRHRDRIHGGTETLDLGIAPGYKRVPDMLSHDGCIILEFIFPLWIGIAIMDREEGPEEPVYDIVTPDLQARRTKEPAGDRFRGHRLGTFMEERLAFGARHARRVDSILV
jgi:hypothetical protein